MKTLPALVLVVLLTSNSFSQSCKEYFGSIMQHVYTDSMYQLIEKGLNDEKINIDAKCELRLLSLYTTVGMINGKVDTIKKYREVILHHDSISNYPDIALQVNHNLGAYYINNRIDSSCVQYYSEIISNAKTCRDSFTYLVDISNCYTNTKEFNLALTSLILADSIQERCSVHKTSKLENIRSLAATYFNIEDYENSIYYHKKYLTNINQLDPSTIFSSYYLYFKAALRAESDVVDSVIDSLRKYEAYNTDGKALYNYALGEKNIFSEKYDQALPYLKNSHELLKASNDTYYQFSVGKYLLFCLSLTDNIVELNQYLSEIKPNLARQGNMIDSLTIRGYEVIANQLKYDRQSAKDLALYIHELSNYYDDNYRLEIKGIEAKWQNEKKTLENETLKKENDLKALRISKQNTTLSLFGTLAALLGGLLYYMYNTQRRIIRQKEEIQTLNGEIAHRVKNQFALATSLLGSHRKNAQDQTYKTLVTETENQLRVISSVNKRLNPTDGYTKVALDEVLSEIIDDLQYTMNSLTKLNVDFHKDLESIKISEDKATYLGLIINELITNTYKHAFTNQQSPQININISNDSHALVMKYEDNGTGLVDKKKHSGSTLNEQIAKFLNATVSVSGSDGFSYKLTMPHEK